MNNYFNSGLNDEEVIKSRKKYGSNSIAEKKQNKFIDFLLDALADPIIKILLIALAIKLVFLFKDFDLFETLGIVIAIFVATFISSLSEYGSENFRRHRGTSSENALPFFGMTPQECTLDGMLRCRRGVLEW